MGCGSDSSDASSSKSDAEYQATIVDEMHDSLLLQIQQATKSSQALCDAAPVTKGRGWDATTDAHALSDMRDAWEKTRLAYEQTEGALAPLFPEVDSAVDARYDDFLAALGPQGDSDLFDDEGVTGLHGIERILWAQEIPENVVKFEASLPGYKKAAFPSTEQEASDFKKKLCQKLVDDFADLESQWTPASIDLGSAFQGLISLVNEQQEKVNKASSNEEESRYSQRTMFDIRNNLKGTRTIYALFKPWLRGKAADGDGKSGKDTDDAIQAGFEALDKLYGQTKGDAIPRPPSDWSAEDPSRSDLDSAFGRLYTGIHDAVDPDAEDSIVHNLNHAATLVGFPEFEEEE
jgi:iron uptake system component EfeO